MVKTEISFKNRPRGAACFGDLGLEAISDHRLCWDDNEANTQSISNNKKSTALRLRNL